VRTDNWPDMSDTQRAILNAWLDAEPETRQQDIADAVGCSQPLVSMTLAQYGDLVLEESNKRLRPMMRRVDAVAVREALKGGAAGVQWARLAYQRLGLLVDKSINDHRIDLAPHEQQTLDEEGDIDALVDRLPGLRELLGRGPDGPAESVGLPEGAGASSDATADAPA